MKKGKIRFNKMVKGFSIHKGDRFIGVIDIKEVFEFINEEYTRLDFYQIDDEKKMPITFEIIDRELCISKGKLKVGSISFTDFYDYMKDNIKDIKYFSY